jgi:hypothetical protein
MIEPPADLPWNDESLAAWSRVTSNLERLGAWHPAFRTACFVAATQSALYVQCCRTHGIDAKTMEDCRVTARQWLTDSLYLHSVLTARLDDRGRDIDLLELCSPLESAA